MSNSSRLVLVGTMAVVLLMVLAVGPSSAQEGFLGEIRMVGFNWAPQGWLACEGQELPIAQYTALFSLLGATFGGNGTTNFKLPDLRGAIKVGDKTVTVKFIICATDGIYPQRP